MMCMYVCMYVCVCMYTPWVLCVYVHVHVDLYVYVYECTRMCMPRNGLGFDWSSQCVAPATRLGSPSNIASY